MSLLYVDDDKATIGIDANRCYVHYEDGMKSYVPIEVLDSITITGHAQMTTQCIQECLKRGIPVSFMSKGGRYFGRLHSTGHINTERQRMQCALYDTDFSVELAKRIMSAKLRNQGVVLRRYEKSNNLEESENIKAIKRYREKLNQCTRIDEIMGYEGQAAKTYFEGISELIANDFKFKGRSRRPPLDEFNSMLSLGYSILMNEIYGKIEAKGLSPYFGFIHRDKEKHPTLASDLMEEWRAVIVDTLVVGMINGSEVHKDHFYYDIDEPGCYITKDGLKIILSKIERRLQTEVKYLDYIDFPVSFRRAMTYQIDSLIDAMASKDASLYKPIEIR